MSGDVPAMKRLKSGLAGAIALAFFSVPSTSQAAENGVGIYLLGFRGPQAGIVPPPGLYFQNDTYFYKGSANPSREIPYNGQLVADVRATMWANVPTLLWSTPIQIAGGNLAFTASLPIGGPTIDAGVALSAPPINAVIARNLHDRVATIGDPLLTSLVAWHAGNFHWNAGVTTNIPVGDYREGAIANIAFHRWAADLFAAATWLDQASGHELSGTIGITFNGRNPTTDYTTGTEFHAEFAALQHVSRQFNLGVVGYYYDQLTGDSGSGARLGPFKGRVAALGGTVGYTFMAGQLPIATRVKVFREFDVRNRLEGTAGFFTISLPLSVAVPPAPAQPLITK